MKKIIPILLFIISSCYSTVSKKTGLEGQSVPNFTLLLPDSTIYSNAKYLKLEQPLVLFYYSPRCPYCRAQIKNIIDNMDKLKDINFFLVTDYPFSEIKQFNKTYSLSKYRNIINGKDIKNQLADYYQVQNVPYLAVYGKDNKLTEVFKGKTYSSYIRKAAFP